MSWYARPIVAVSDVAASLRYYAGDLGFHEQWRYEEQGALLIAQVERGGCELILSSQWPAKVGQAMQFISLDLDVLTALRSDLESRGVAVKDGRWGYPLMILSDPDGNELLFSYPSDDETSA